MQKWQVQVTILGAAVCAVVSALLQGAPRWTLIAVAVVLAAWALFLVIKRPTYEMHPAPVVPPAAGVVSSPVRANTPELSRPVSDKTLPELRPYVVAVSYKQLQQLNALGFETQNRGKEAAVEISIPNVKLGTSIIQFEGNYQRLTVNQSAYWRLLIKHDTGGFSSGNALVNEMREQGERQIIVPIHYKNDNELYYVTWARFELDASAESGITVHNDAQKLIKWPTAAQPIEVPFPATAPRPYLEVDDPIGAANRKTTFIFTNRGGELAQNVQVQPLTVAGFTVVFPPISVIHARETGSTIPNIPGTGIMQNHDILSLMVREWDRNGTLGEDDEWKISILVTYEDFVDKRYEASADLVVFPIRRMLRDKHAADPQPHKYKTVEVRNMKFRVVK